MRVRRCIVIFCFMAVSAFSDVPTLFAQDLAAGRVKLGDEEVPFSAPLGLWDAARHRVSVTWFTNPPSPAAETAARQAGRWDTSGAGPAVILDLDYAPGSISGLVSQLVECRVRFSGFRTSLELHGKAADCHILSVGGMLRAGGAMAGLLQGQGKNYTLRLPFPVTFTSAAVGAAAAPPAPATPAKTSIPANSIAGGARFNGQHVKFTHGMSWWVAAKNEVRMAFFDHAPPPNMLAQLRADSWGEGGPNMSLHFRLEPGAAVTPAAVSYCYLGVEFAKGGPISNNTSARGCGISELGGDAKAGGNIIARLKGESTGPGDKPYSWELSFNLPIAK